MLVFMAKAIKRFSKNTIAHTITAVFDPSAVSDLLTSINFRASQADVEASNCERVLNLQDREKLHNLVAEELFNIDAKIEGLWVRLLEDERSELLQWLSPIQYASDHDFAKSGRVVHTGSWLLGREAFRRWEESNVSEIFWLHGIRMWTILFPHVRGSGTNIPAAGAGKTKLSFKVIDNAETHLDKSRNKETMVYFYCDRNRSDHRDPASITRSFIMDSAAPLSPEELVAAVCQSSDGLVPHDLDIDTEFVLEACHNLVVIMGSTCRFSHLSVQEYLESHDWPNKLDDQLLGAVCLHLLMASDDIFTTNALRKYADHYWHKHFTDCDPEAHEARSVTAPLLLKFLGRPTSSSRYYRQWVSSLRAWKRKLPSIDIRDLQPSQSAAFDVVTLGLLARWLGGPETVP
jgi:hypothetical protein